MLDRYSNLNMWKALTHTNVSFICWLFHFCAKVFPLCATAVFAQTTGNSAKRNDYTICHYFVVQLDYWWNSALFGNDKKLDPLWHFSLILSALITAAIPCAHLNISIWIQNAKQIRNNKIVLFILASHGPYWNHFLHSLSPLRLLHSSVCDSE